MTEDNVVKKSEASQGEGQDTQWRVTMREGPSCEMASHAEETEESIQ